MIYTRYALVVQKHIFSNLFLLFLFIIDRVSKHWMYIYRCLPWNITEYVPCEYAINRGIAWSLFHSESSYTYAFVSLSVLVVAVFLCWMWICTPQIGYGLVVSGALSNICDRFVYGGVLDFIHLSCKGWSWPLFNLADVWIVIGVLLLGYQQRRQNAKVV